MTPVAPPAWMERILLLLLPSKDRATIAGDLYEEFRERKLSKPGRLGADLWYLRQVASFVPRRLRACFVHPRALALSCSFTALCGGWLGAMDLRLHHPIAQVGIAAAILFEAMLTLASLRFDRLSLIRYVAMLGCLPQFWLATNAWLGVVRGGNMEGYILLIALALFIQGILTLGTLSMVRRAA